MSLPLISTVADLLTSFGMIASLLFVAVQIRKNTQEVRNTQYQATQERMTTLLSRTMNERVAAIVQKGKRSYVQLDEAEKLVFASWLFEFHAVTHNVMMLSRQRMFASQFGEMARVRLEKMLRNPGVREFYEDKDRDAFPAWANEYASKIYGDSQAPGDSDSR